MKVLIEESTRQGKDGYENVYYLYLESDGMQFILREYNGNLDKNGNGVYKTIGYYSSVAGAINALVKMKLMDSTAETLGELLNEVQGIREYIESKIAV